MGTVRIGGVVKGSPSTQFWLEADWVAQDQANNRSLLRVWLRAANGPSGTTGSNYGGFGKQVAHVNGAYMFEHNGNPFLPSGYGQNQTRWHDSGDWWIGHDGEGNLGGQGLSMLLQYGSINESHYGSIEAPPRIPKPPTPPRNLSVANLTPTSAGVNYAGSADYRGANVVGWTADWYEINNSTNPLVWRDLNSNGYTSPANGAGPALKPGTTYHVYIYARTSNAGDGQAASIALTTLPSDPPGMSVLPSFTGQSAKVTLTSPNGVSGVTQWVYEYRTSPAGAVTQTATQSNVLDVTGLTPGSLYDFRARVSIGNYASPWTAWTTVQMPNPNTNPGNYFDGNTTDIPGELLYSWVGTANASRSIAQAYGVDGWAAAFDVAGAGVLYGVPGGLVSARAARVTFFRDMTAAGQWNAGQQMLADSWSDVEPGATYTFSIFVNPSRSQRLAARVYMQSAEGLDATVGAVVTGDAVVCPANTWTRLAVVATASPTPPMEAERAVVRVVDVAGAGYTNFLGGDYVLLDGAMNTLGVGTLPYFDGATPDTTEFIYSWEGLPFFSTSIRQQNTTVLVDRLADPDCPPVPQPPTPPIIASDCIDEIGIWRRYLMAIPADRVPLWGAVLPTLTLNTNATAERQVRIRYYANPENLQPETLDKSEWEAELILTYIPAGTTVTMDGVTRRVIAEFSDGSTAPADHLLYGTGGVPATWPELSCGWGYVVSLDVPLEAPAGNLSAGVQLTGRV